MMNLNSLDATLRALTPSEKRYKCKKDYYNFDAFPLIEHNGQKVLLMQFESGDIHLSASHGLLSMVLEYK